MPRSQEPQSQLGRGPRARSDNEPGEAGHTCYLAMWTQRGGELVVSGAQASRLVTGGANDCCF